MGGKNRHPHVGFHMEKELLELMDIAASSQGITRTELVKRAIRVYLLNLGFVNNK